MLWYVAVIAVLNLGLGYGIAHLMGAGRRQLAAAGDPLDYAEAADTER